MPFGMGPLGWMYAPYWSPWGAPWYWGATPYGIPYGAPWATIPKEQEIAVLEDQARVLERDLESIRKRLEELQK